MRQIVWNIDSLPVRSDSTVAVEGKPKVVSAGKGSAVEFDGAGDGIIVHADPVEGAFAFTVEAVFRPDRGGAREQRFIHIQEHGSENRILLETRLTDSDQWYADTYIRSGATDMALKDQHLVHQMGQWHSMALSFDGNLMVQYINGIQELSASIAYVPHGKGMTSIGMRINKVYWFRGAIRVVRFTTGIALPSDHLLGPIA